MNTTPASSAASPDELERNDHAYLIAQHRHNPELVRKYADMLLSRGAQGLILIDTHLTEGLRVPVVAVASHRTIPCVTNLRLNHELAAELTMRHLHQLGHRRIAVVRGQSLELGRGHALAGHGKGRPYPRRPHPPQSRPPA